MRRLLAVLLPCWLLAPAVARAEQPAPPPDHEWLLSNIELELRSSRELGRNMDQPRCGVTGDAKFLGPVRYLAARGEASFERLGVFAATRGFRLGDLAPVYDVEGGAAFELLRGVELTGTFRVLGVGWAAGVPERSAAPVLGIHLDF
jgi:hypothetical protein